MISIIVCSISPEFLQKFSSNVEKTIGANYELIVHNNNTDKLSIAKAYNKCAKIAKYPYLLFAHEDILFNTQNWSNPIIKKLKETDCGIIGFAGSTAKPQSYSGWMQCNELNIMTIIQYDKKGKIISSPDQIFAPFIPAICIDGLALFMRKEVWKENPFDEKLLSGFHCYDLDISIQAAQKYKNYICGCITVTHFSQGNFNKEWVLETIKMHDYKWNKMLPLYAENITGVYNKKEIEEIAFYNFIWHSLRANIALKTQYKLIKRFMFFPLSKNHFSHIMTCSWKFLRNCFTVLKQEEGRKKH